ncbi:hypothetical protein KR059_012383, partial [Drosophila kikkawai]
MERSEILALRVEELRRKLSELQLNTTGLKAELQQRLLTHYGLIDEGESENEGEAAEFRSTSSTPTNNRNRAVRQHGQEAQGQSRSWFTLKDVEGSVSQFSGVGDPNIDLWIEELEDCAATVEWSSLQQFVYAKQLLSGAAKMFVRSQRDINDWESLNLKSALLQEFGVQISTAEIHRRLGKRRQHKGESLQEYLYALMEIAKPIRLEDESLIEYFVEGIPDARSNKSMLYQARNLKDL